MPPKAKIRSTCRSFTEEVVHPTQGLSGGLHDLYSLRMSRLGLIRLINKKHPPNPPKPLSHTLRKARNGSAAILAQGCENASVSLLVMPDSGSSSSDGGWGDDDAPAAVRAVSVSSGGWGDSPSPPVSSFRDEEASSSEIVIWET